jgi:transposase-like protein
MKYKNKTTTKTTTIKKASKKTKTKKTTTKFGKQCSQYETSFINDILHQYEKNGKSVHMLGEEFKIPVSTIHGWIKRHKDKEITQYRQHRKSKGKRYDLPFKQAVVKKIQEEGRTVKDMVKITGASKASIHKWIDANTSQENMSNMSNMSNTTANKANQAIKDTGVSSNHDVSSPGAVWLTSKDLVSLKVVTQQRDYYKREMEKFMLLYYSK